jgi:hypothetical protein
MDNLITWLDEFINIMHIVDYESISKIFPHKLNKNSLAQAWWEHKYATEVAGMKSKRHSLIAGTQSR